MRRWWLACCSSCSLSLFTLNALCAPVAVIHGDKALPDGERRFAQSLARHVERWYKEVGVEVSLASDKRLAHTLAGKKVAVLVYPGTPNPQQMADLTAFVKANGKLIVCYSSSPALAELMGVRCVGYRKGSTDGRWSSMHFLPSRPAGVPPRIIQTSSNLFVMEPVQGRSRVLAWWHDRQDKRVAEPAWLVSQQGYWMSHVLLADGDAEAKAQLLFALTAAHDPSLWKPAAHNVLARARRIGGGLDSISATAARLSDPRRRAAAINATQTLRQCDQTCVRLLSSDKGYEAWNKANEFRARMYEAYGMLQQTRRGEIRAVWDHSGRGLYPGDWERTCRLLKEAGMTDIYVNVAGAAFAHYNSQVLPRSRVFDEQGDQLAACAAAAQQHGIRAHAWLLCFSTEGATPARMDIFKQRRWLLTSEGGATRPWLDPAIPEVRQYLRKAILEMATRYNVAGVHLDFVRYPDFTSSLGPTVKTGYERATGQHLPNWPDVVKSGAQRRRFHQWRAEQLSELMRTTRREMRRAAPAKVLTAAVYGKYPSCYEAVGQDWVSWINTDLLDYVVPMNYTEDMGRFREWLTQQTATRQQALRVLPGIGVTAAESRLDAAQVIDQINMSRKAGCPGFALFNLDTTLRQQILPTLRLGACAP